MESLDALRMNQFQSFTDNSLRTLPPSRDGLTEHIKPACLQRGFEWRAPVDDLDFTDAGVEDSLIINTFQNDMTLVIQLTLSI